ncbi:MAG: 3'-5' exonuclease [Thermodesulfitimonas sp.]
MSRVYHLLQVFDSFRIRLRRANCRAEEIRMVVDELNRWRETGVPLGELTYVAFDLETTGLYPFGGDRITALGAVLVEEGKVTGERFERLVNPGRAIPLETVRLTGIADSLVATAPPVEKVLPEFLGFLSQGVPVGFNADFDLAFLNLALRPFGLKLKRTTVIDVLTLIRALNPNWENFQLDEAARFYGVPLVHRHSALGDAVIHARLFLRVLSLLEERGIYTLKELKSYLHYRGLW